MKLKLSKRELKLVIVLGITLFSVAYYKFLVIPQVARADALKITRDQKRNELGLFKKDLMSQGRLEKELISLQEKITDNTKNYFLSLNQEEIIVITNAFITDLDMKFMSVNFEEPREEELRKDKEKDEEEQDVGEEIETDAEIDSEDDEKSKELLEVHTVDLEYEGDYNSLLKFLNNINDYQKKIMIKDISINKDEEDETKLSGNIVLDFYIIGKIINEEELLYAWQPNGLSTNANPFSKINGFASASDKEKSASEAEKMADNTSSQISSQVSKTNTNSSESGGVSSISDNTEKNVSKENNNKESVSKDNSENKGSSSDSKKNNNEDKKTDKPSATNTGTEKPGTSKPGNSTGNKDEDKKPVSLNKTLVSFESLDNMFFVGSDRDIIGNLKLNKSNKVEGESSLSLRYDFVEKRSQSTASVAFNNSAVIREQPRSLLLNVYPIDKSKNSLGIVIRDREGYEYDFKFTDDLSWDGWKNLSIDLPIDINYPAVVERVYVESRDFYEKITGEVLLDDLKLIYDR